MRRVLIYVVLPFVAAILAAGLMNYDFLRSQLAFYLAGGSKAQNMVIDFPQRDESEVRGANILVIRRLGIAAPIKYVDKKSEKAFQEALKEGVVHYPGTALPGAPGNVYIFGHSSDYVWVKGHYKAVFALLPKIEEGDKIIATDAEGRPFTYVVIRSFAVSPNDLSVLNQFEYKEKLLTLQTSYPVGTALKRWIVLARLSEELKSN